MRRLGERATAGSIRTAHGGFGMVVESRWDAVPKGRAAQWHDEGRGARPSRSVVPVRLGFGIHINGDRVASVQPPRFETAGPFHYGSTCGTAARPVRESPAVTGGGSKCCLAASSEVDARREYLLVADSNRATLL